MSKIKFLFGTIVVSSFVFPNNQSIISYELKYASGGENSIDYFENILDVNYFFDNGIYLFTQLEYSDPPLLGTVTENFDDLTNIFYLQYSKPSYEITIGDLYLLYGRGLALHTFQDKAIDYDNSIRGIDFRYYLNERIDISSSIGSSNIKSRINPADLIPSVSIENTFRILGVSANVNDNINISYSGAIYSQNYDYSDISSLMGLTNLLGEYLISRSAYIISEKPNDKIKNIEHNFGFDIYFGSSTQLYFEKSLVYYDKILSERLSGHKDYISFYTNIFNFDFLFEYKDYNTPFLYNVFSAPPIVFKEPTSILSSRNFHSIDFTNEIGYMLEINKLFSNSLNMVLNYSFALHHLDGVDDPKMFSFFTEKEILELEDYWPYQQYSIDFSNSSKNGNLFYKIGYDYYNEITSLKTIKTKTIPMLFSYNFDTGNSMTFYIESQNKESSSESSEEEHDYLYFSPTYNHYGKWTLSVFYDYEVHNEAVNGYDFTFNYKESQFSIFLGSQKGGLVCANGSCILQPDFQDGVKVSYLTNF